MTSIGPIVVRQSDPYKEHVSHECDNFTGTKKCKSDEFDVGEHKCDIFSPNQRKCSEVNPRVCEKVWGQYATAKKHSGDKLYNAKVECTWANIPDEHMTRGNIEEFLREYGRDAKDPELGYNDAMAAYCLSITTNCMPGLQGPDGEPVTCSLVHSGDGPTRQFCGGWWDGIKGTKEGDRFLTKACPPGSSRADCKCVNATRGGDPTFHELASKIPFPEACWYAPCRATSTHEQFRGSSHEGVLCDGNVCINEGDINFAAEDGAVLQDVTFDLAQTCEMQETSQRTTTEEHTSTSSSETSYAQLETHERREMDPALIVVGVGLVIVLGAMMLKRK